MPAPDFHLKLLNLLSTKPQPKSCTYIVKWLKENDEAVAKTFSRLTKIEGGSPPKEKALERFNKFILSQASLDASAQQDFDEQWRGARAAAEHWSKWEDVLFGLRFSLTEDTLNQLLPRTIARIRKFDDARPKMLKIIEPQAHLVLLKTTYGPKITPPITQLIDWLKTEPEGNDIRAAGGFIGLYGLSTLVFDVAKDYVEAVDSQLKLEQIFSADTPFLGWLAAVEDRARLSEHELPERWLPMALARAENADDLKDDRNQTHITKSSMLKKGNQRLSFSELSKILSFLVDRKSLHSDDATDLQFIYICVVCVQNLQYFFDQLVKSEGCLARKIFGPAGASQICDQVYMAPPENLAYSNGQ